MEGEKECLSLTDVNMVAQLLKAFFRELPEPLVPFRWAGLLIYMRRRAISCRPFDLLRHGSFDGSVFFIRLSFRLLYLFTLGSVDLSVFRFF